MSSGNVNGINNKLDKILPKLTERLPSCLTRREETVLSRLHIGHSHVTHLFLLKGEKPPFWVSCDEPLALEYIWLFRSDLIDISDKSILMLISWRCCSKRFLRISSLTFWKREIFWITCKFLIINIHLVLILSSLNVWMSEWFLIWCFILMIYR